MNLNELKNASFSDIEDKAFQAIQRIFPCETDLLDKIPMDKILTHVWPFAEAEKAMRQVKNGEVMKGLVLIEGYADGVKVD